jgi:5-hydroxyisourate hydrolase-like protein (transthyretin family)
MTDAPTGRQLVDKAFVYMTTLSRECRKSLTTSFGQTHKGIPFETVEPILRKEVETWFASRDRNIAIKHEKTDTGRPGEILLTYSGMNKDAHFKFQVDAQFTLSGSTMQAPSYLKTINVNVDKRDFTK